MKKALSIIQLIIVLGIVIYGTICLFYGDFVGAYTTLPILFVYYVWFVARRRRRSLKETDEQ